jgi:hypothetical protein
LGADGPLRASPVSAPRLRQDRRPITLLTPCRLLPVCRTGPTHSMIWWGRSGHSGGFTCAAKS